MTEPKGKIKSIPKQTDGFVDPRFGRVWPEKWTQTAFLLQKLERRGHLAHSNLGVDSPFCSAIVLFKNQHFPRVFGGFLERGSLGRMEMEVAPRSKRPLQPLQPADPNCHPASTRAAASRCHPGDRKSSWGTRGDSSSRRRFLKMGTQRCVFFQVGSPKMASVCQKGPW